MARVENVKMMALAAMIVLATALCEVDRDRVGQVDPAPTPATEIEPRVLVG